MNNKFIYSLLFFCFAFMSNGQELVLDLNPGDEDGGDYCNFAGIYAQKCAVTLDNGIIVMMAKTVDTDYELYAIVDGQINLLKDINPGEDDSDIRFLKAYKGFAYFRASDGNETHIWKTDGTTAGTEVAFEMSTQSPFIIDKNDRMYFTFDGTLYMYDGNDLASIDHPNPLAVSFVSASNSVSFGLYQEGIVLMSEVDAGWDMLYINGTEIELLALVPEPGSFIDPITVHGFDGGVVFGFDANDEAIEGLYVYTASDGMVSLVDEDFTIRGSDINGESCLIISFEAQYLFNKDNPKGLIISDNNPGLFQGQAWPKSNHKGSIIYQSNGGTFEDLIIAISDGTNTEEKELKVTDDLNDFISFNQYTVFFSESDDDFTQDNLRAYNHNTEVLSEEFSIESFGVKIENFIGYQDGYIYFWAELDDVSGREVYRILLDLETKTNEVVEAPTFELNKLSQNVYRILNQTDVTCKVHVLTMDGRLVETIQTKTNESFTIHHNGMSLIQVISEKKMESFKMFLD